MSPTNYERITVKIVLRMDFAYPGGVERLTPEAKAEAFGRIRRMLERQRAKVDSIEIVRQPKGSGVSGMVPVEDT